MIVIADDQMINLEMLKGGMLSLDLQHKCAWCNDGQETIEIA